MSDPRPTDPTVDESALVPPSRTASAAAAGLGLVWWVGAAVPRGEAALWLILMGLLATGALVWFVRSLPVSATDRAGRPAVRRRWPTLLVAVATVVLAGAATATAVALVPGVLTIGAGATALLAGAASGVRAYRATGVALAVIGAIGVLTGLATSRFDATIGVVGLLGAVAWWALPLTALLARMSSRRSGGSLFRLRAEHDDDSWGQEEDDGPPAPGRQR